MRSWVGLRACGWRERSEGAVRGREGAVTGGSVHGLSGAVVDVP